MEPRVVRAVGIAARARALGAGRAPVGDRAVGEAAAALGLEAAKPCRAVHDAVCIYGFAANTIVARGARTRVRAGHIKLQRSALKITSLWIVAYP